MEKVVCLFLLVLAGVHAGSLERASRITAGSVAQENQFPYMVSIQQLTQIAQGTRGHRCGGVLITLQHILTTATCLFNIVNGAPVQINAAEYRVFAGATSLINDTVPDRIRFIANFTIHPNYIGHPAYVNDIAIVTLHVPFNNTVVSPIPLPDRNFMPAEFSVCNVAGWGAQNLTATASTQLRYASKYIFKQDLCTALYAMQPGRINILPTMVCAVSYDQLSAGCNGDEGSPLVCNGGLAGILFQTNACSTTSLPEVYTRVGNYTEWIRSVTGGASTYQPTIFLVALFSVLQMMTAKVVS